MALDGSVARCRVGASLLHVFYMCGMPDACQPPQVKGVLKLDDGKLSWTNPVDGKEDKVQESDLGV